MSTSISHKKERATMHTSLQRRRAGRRDQRGFTLVELLVVVLILGVLAAVVVFSVGGITNRGANASCETEVREVRTAIEAYKAQNTNKNPASLQALQQANLLETAPSITAKPPSPSAVAGFQYNPTAGTYTAPAGKDCPTG